MASAAVRRHARAWRERRRVVGSLAADARVRLHHRRQHRSNGRKASRSPASSSSASSSRRWCRGCCVRRSCASRRGARRPGAALHRMTRRPRPCGSSPTGPTGRLPEEYEDKLREATESHHLPARSTVLFVEVRPRDASDSADHCMCRAHAWAATRCCAASAPRFRTRSPRCCCTSATHRQAPHAYFGWTEGNPIAYLLKFLAFGEGDMAPVTREVLRQAESLTRRAPPAHPPRVSPESNPPQAASAPRLDRIT